MPVEGGGPFRIIAIYSGLDELIPIYGYTFI